MSQANSRYEQSEKDLYNFIVCKSAKALNDLIDRTWRLREAPASIEREKLCRMTALKRVLASECVPGCNSQWIVCARQVLRQNVINIYVFAAAIRKLIEKGRQKQLNLLLVGPTNCGKSFLLNPIEIIYKTFANPATGKYAWLGLDESEVAYLNDFRWSSELIAWNDLLFLLEGKQSTFHVQKISMPQICA